MPAIIAVLAFGVLSLVGGWLVVHDGGFFHAPSRHSSQGSFHGGAPAALMAVIQLSAAAIAFTWSLRSVLASVPAAAIACAAVYGPPLAYVLLR